MKQWILNSFFAIALLSSSSVLVANSDSNDSRVLVQSTTSTANSGLYKYLLPLFESQTNIKVNVVAVGTGQAIQNAKNCDADVLLVHAKAAEEKFVAEGYGVERFDLMYNDFVVIGPNANPALIDSSDNAESALQKVINAKALFASRGDDSGTHKKELSLWSLIADKNGFSADNVDDQSWYRSTGSGMGATINTAIGLSAYTLTDRASWISFNNRSDYTIALEGDPLLFNQYGVIQVSQAKCPSANAKNAKQLIDWLLSVDTQQAIADFKIDGQQLFYPNANASSQ